MSESRDSLHFLNRTCEQLEAKVEELEATNEGLCKMCEDRQVAIEQKNAVAWELKEKLESLEEENKLLREELNRVKQSPDRTEISTTEAIHKGPTEGQRARRLCPEDHHRQQEVLLKRMAELQQELDQVSQKLQNSHYQRQKLQKELGDVLEENQLLCRELEKVEQESMELQAKLTLQEEASERQNSLESSLSSSTSIRRHRTLSSHSNGFHDRFLLPSPAPEDQRSHKTPLDLTGTLGVSLFSELDTQYTTLHRQYSELLQDCTCSASLAHKRGYQVAVTEVDGSHTQYKRQTSQTDRPFKELFDEVFATLKQTAQVADRLIERRSNNLDQS